MKKLMFVLMLVLLCFPVMAIHEREHIDRVTLVDTVMEVLEPSMFVGSTDYLFNDTGKIFVQILNGTNQPDNNASCFVRLGSPMTQYSLILPK